MLLADFTLYSKVHVQVGPVSLVIYMKWGEAALKSALKMEGDEKAFTKKMEEFNKHVLPLATHKRSITVDGEAGPAACMSACSEALNRVAIAGC
ncbi:hypothetical protein J6590_087068 [Homalodisca vitripennis]|nr:hypothetical protein J6590_087068 [Homalodisca vitripennis]